MVSCVLVFFSFFQRSGESGPDYASSPRSGKRQAYPRRDQIHKKLLSCSLTQESNRGQLCGSKFLAVISFIRRGVLPLLCAMFWKPETGKGAWRIYLPVQQLDLYRDVIIV